MIKYPSEHDEQSAFVSWFKTNHEGYVILSIPNGGTRNKLEAFKLKQEGLLKGAFDLQILTPDKEIIFIEFKRQKNSYLSKEQKEFKRFLDSVGFKNFVAYGFKDGVGKLKAILS